MALICSLLLLISSFWSCNKDLVEYSQGDIKVKIVEGDEWLHDFPLFLSINKKNPPQVAIWLEDTNGNRKLWKKRHAEKIDNVAALVDAMVAYKLNKEAFEWPKKS